MIVIHARIMGEQIGKIDTVKIEKEDFDDAVEHAKWIMKNSWVFGVQITWEKESE